MKANGFSLTELIAVVAILGIVAIITTTALLNILRPSEEKLYNTQITNIKDAARKWSITYSDKLPTTEASCSITPKQLVEAKYLEAKGTIDPRDKSELKGCVVITYDDTNNKYLFNYEENNCSNPC